MSQSLSRLADRPARLSAALKVGLLLLVADMAVLGGKALATNDAGRESAAVVATLPDTPPPSPVKVQCREATVSLDEGYGLQGHKTQVICTQAF
jgi:hypothetical protein